MQVKPLRRKYCCQQIDEMHQKLRQQHPALVNRKGPILLHDNARPHVAKPTLQKLNEMGYETLLHPPYSPDLLPTDCHFFKHLNNFLHEKCFKNLSDIKNALSDFIATRTQDFCVTGHECTCFALASVLILMVLISMNKFLFEPRYVLLNLKVKNRKNFLDNLIYVGLVSHNSPLHLLQIKLFSIFFRAFHSAVPCMNTLYTLYVPNGVHTNNPSGKH